MSYRRNARADFANDLFLFPFGQQFMVKGPIVRNSTVPETPLEQWPTMREPGSLALPLLHVSDPYRRPLSSPRIDDQRLADLAHEILATAIRLAAMLEVAQQINSAQQKDAAKMAAVGGAGNA